MSGDRLSQNDQVVTFTLVELLTQLVFVAMLLAVVLRDEVEQKFADPGREIQQLKNEVLKLKRQNADLRRKNAYLEDQLRLRSTGYQPSEKFVPVSAEKFRKYTDWTRKQARGGKDLPPCASLPGFVLAIRFPAGGIAGKWIGPGQADQSSIPGMTRLASGEILDKGAFRAAAAAANGWARKQTPSCALRVRIDAGSMVDTRKQGLVRQYFYEVTR
jgi:cell division protein FtsB